MAPTPAHLRAAADGLRRTARRLDVELAPLVALGDHRTWEGPAATAHRRAAADADARRAGATAGLRAVAARLDQRADEAEAAEERAAEEARRARQLRRADHGLGPRRVPDARDRRRPDLLRPGSDVSGLLTGGGDGG